MEKLNLKNLKYELKECTELPYLTLIYDKVIKNKIFVTDFIIKTEKLNTEDSSYTSQMRQDLNISYINKLNIICLLNGE